MQFGLRVVGGGCGVGAVWVRCACSVPSSSMFNVSAFGCTEGVLRMHAVIYATPFLSLSLLLLENGLGPVQRVLYSYPYAALLRSAAKVQPKCSHTNVRSRVSFTHPLLCSFD